MTMMYLYSSMEREREREGRVFEEWLLREKKKKGEGREWEGAQIRTV